ncbi:MAG: hypothetical protein ABIK09_07675 [Pseudomonadota bacterium]
MTDELRAAGDVDSWCTKCRMWLAHTIIAMVGGIPKRVMCNTCHGEHTYRPHPPGERPTPKKAGVVKGRSTPKPRKAKTSEWETRVGGRDRREALPYKPQGTFKVDQIMDHRSFGIGLVVATLAGDKIKVLFETGDKILIHARPPLSTV